MFRASIPATRPTRPKIGVHIYFPPSFGGGERYLLTAAEALATLGDVDFVSPVAVDLAAYESAYGLDLSGVRSVAHRRRPLHSYRDWLRPRRYDLFVALDNHLAPMQMSLGRRGIFHLQTPPYPPFKDRPRRARLKLRTYDVIVCNSDYTRMWAERYGTAGLPTRVLYPPVDVDLYRPLRKRPVILSVGRFFVGRHEKKHALMIEAFRDLARSGLEGWELHLAGSIRESSSSDVAYLEELRRSTADLPVRFFVNASLGEMRRLYGEASLYWHATGYGVDEETYPQFLEHFGMAVVEAMAAGAVPVVIGRGGPLEIVEDGETGFFWHGREEWLALTRRLAAVPEGELEPIRRRAGAAAQRFSKVRFSNDVRALGGQLLVD